MFFIGLEERKNLVEKFVNKNKKDHLPFSKEKAVAINGQVKYDKKLRSNYEIYNQPCKNRDGKKTR